MRRLLCSNPQGPLQRNRNPLTINFTVGSCGLGHRRRYERGCEVYHGSMSWQVLHSLNSHFNSSLADTRLILTHLIQNFNSVSLLITHAPTLTACPCDILSVSLINNCRIRLETRERKRFQDKEDLMAFCEGNLW
jgi:hypothetical protein